MIIVDIDRHVTTHYGFELVITSRQLTSIINGINELDYDNLKLQAYQTSYGIVIRHAAKDVKYPTYKIPASCIKK